MHFWNRTLTLVSVGLIFAMGPRSTAFAQDFVLPSRINPEDSNEAVRQFRLVDAYVMQHAWPEAVELLSQIIESYPHQVVPIPDSKPMRYVSIRTYCQHRLSSFPPEGRDWYRERVDSQAKALMDKYDKTKNSLVLMQIVDEYFASGVGDDACEALGDHYSGRGDLSEAIGLWDRLLPRITKEEEPTSELQLHHPDVDVDIPRLWAKWSIVQLMRGQPSLAQRGFEQLQSEFPRARGSLGGREGTYADIVGYFLTNAESLPPVSHSTDWGTFGGNFARSKSAKGSVAIGTVDRQWSLATPDVSVEEVDRMGDFGPARFNFEPRPRPRLVRDGLHLSPVTLGSRVFACDGQSLYEFDASSDQLGPVWQEKFPTQEGMNVARGADSERHTLTVTDRYLLARSGTVLNRGLNPIMGAGSASPSQLYCFDHRRRKLLWWLSSEALGLGTQTLFEGAPVVHAGESVVVGLSRVDAMSTSYVASIDLETGRVKWTRLICEATNDPEQSSSPDRNLLTLAGDTVYLCTNRGAIAAVDLPLAKVKWLTEYETEPDATLKRVTLDVNPCVYHNGRLTVAPSGAGAVMGLDAQTGRRNWRSRLSVEHLLGAQDGLVFATGKRVYAIHEETGSIAWRFPTNEATGVGRGILAGNKLFWPTATEIHVLDQQTGSRATAPISLLDGLRVKSGNLVPGKDFVALAEGRTISVLRSYRWLKEQRSLIASRNPDSADAHFHLAEAARADEDYDLAVEHYRRAAELSPSYAVVEGQSLKELAEARRFDADCRRASLPGKTNAGQEGAKETERRFLAIASKSKEPRDRFVAFWECAKRWEEQGEIPQAQDIVRRMLDDPVILDAMIPLSEARLQRGEDIIAERFPEVHASEMAKRNEHRPIEGQRWLLLALGKGDADRASRRDDPKANRVADWRTSLATVGSIVTSPGSEYQKRREALVQYETYLVERGFERSAKRIRKRIAREYPEKAGDGPHELSDAVGVNSPARKTLRVIETWRSNLRAEHVLVPNGEAPSEALAGVIETKTDESWGYVLSATGASAWTVTASGPPSWATYSTAGLLCRFADRITMFDLETGAEIWSWSAKAPTNEWRDPTRDATAGEWQCDDDYGYWITDDGLIHAIDLYEGRWRWQWKLPSRATANPTTQWGIGRDSMAVAYGDSVMGFDRRGGRPLWSQSRDSIVSDTPMICHEGVVVFLRSADELIGVSIDSGSVSWRKSLGMPTFAQPRLALRHDQLMLEREGYSISLLEFDSGAETREFAFSSMPGQEILETVELSQGRIGIETLQNTFIIDIVSGEVETTGALPRSMNAACLGDWLRFEHRDDRVQVKRYDFREKRWLPAGEIQEMESPAQLLLAGGWGMIVGSRKSVGVSLSSD